MATVRDRIFDVFRAHGLNTILGNPGSTELPFLQEFPNDFQYILGLQEASVVAMAIGYSFMNGKPTIANLHTTAGTGNAMGSIVTAWHAQAPVIITAGQQDRRQIRTEPFLWGNQVEFVKPYVKWSIEPHQSIDVPEALERGFHIAMTEPRGPVFVSIPMDGLEENCSAVETRKVSYRCAPDAQAILEFAKILSKAERPVIVAGDEIDASGANNSWVLLAERLKAAVFISPLSFRWSFPSDHELFRGRLPPAMKQVGEVLSNYDVVFVLGAPVFHYYPYVPGPAIREGTIVLQITNDPQKASRAITGSSIVGNVALGIAQLLETVETKSNRKSPSPRTIKSPTIDDSIPPSAEIVHARLAQAIPPDAVIFEEAPSSESFFRAVIKEPKSYFTTASGGLGFGMPAAVGAALAKIGRPIVCIVGDGSSQYSIQSHWSAVNYGAAVTFIVLNNSEYGILKSFAMLLKIENVPGLEVSGIDFEGLSKGYGIRFRRILDPATIILSVREAIASDKPCVIEIPIDPKVRNLLK